MRRVAPFLLVPLLVAGAAVWWWMAAADVAPPGVGRSGLELRTAVAAPATAASAPAPDLAATPTAAVREFARDGSSPAREVLVRGKVVGAARQAIAGAEVLVADYPPPELDDPEFPLRRHTDPEAAAVTVRTDGEGRFVARLPAAVVELWLSVRSRGFLELHEQVDRGVTADVDVGVLVDLTLAAAGSVDLTADPSATLVVRARPIDTAAVGDTGSEEVVVRDGRGVLDGLLPGRWELTARGGESAGAVTRTVDVVAGAATKVAF